MKRPLIGIPTFASPGNDWSPARFVLNQSYPRAISQAGGAPLLLPILGERKLLESLFYALEGLLLPGGADIEGHWYGGKAGGDPEPERDRMELTLIGWAYAANLPTLGICRGQQLMNVAMGGTLYQDLATQRNGQRHTNETRKSAVHSVALDSKSKLAAILGETSLEVNSLHHQGIDRLANALLPTAYAEDRLIEAIEAPEKPFWLAVQWHPEELVDAPSQRLFRAFVDAASSSLRRR